MLVKELIKELKKEDQNHEVWFARDEEGNTYHKKAIVQLTDLGVEEDKSDSKVVVVIYPINTSEDIS